MLVSIGPLMSPGFKVNATDAGPDIAPRSGNLAVRRDQIAGLHRGPKFFRRLLQIVL